MCPHSVEGAEKEEDGDDGVTEIEIKPINKNKTTEEPANLQWISVGKGGKVSSIRTVRSHVKRQDHKKRRETEKAKWKDTANRLVANVQLAKKGDNGDEGETGVQNNTSSPPEQKPLEDVLTTPSEPSQGSSSSSPLRSIQDQANNLIPYAWFEAGGPVLYVNRSKWPFAAPLNVTGSDRNDLSPKTLIPRQSAWAPYVRVPDRIAVQGAVLDPKVLQWIGQTEECYQFRVDTINWIQTQLDDPVTSICNSTIGAIMTFAMWTAGYGNPEEMNKHMDAVECIVSLRGGFRAFLSDELMGMKLILFDSIIAVQTGLPTRFPRVDYFLPRPVTTNTETRWIRNESPLFGSGNFTFIIRYPRHQAAIISVLGRMWALTRFIESLEPSISSCSSLRRVNEGISNQEEEVVPFVNEPTQPYTAPLLTLPLLSSCNGSCTTNHVLETLLSCGAIYHQTLTSHLQPPQSNESPDSNTTFQPSTSQHDFPSISHKLHYNHLCISFSKCTDAEFWLRYPGILLWVLLVGTAASRAKREAAWWLFYLSRTGAYTSVEGQLAASSAIRRFLDLQSWIRDQSAMAGPNELAH